MALLDCIKDVYSYLGLDVDLAPSGGEDPDGYKRTQILHIINTNYQNIAIRTKCIEDKETITPTTTSETYESAIPTGYSSTIKITPAGDKRKLTETSYSSFGTFYTQGLWYYALFKESIFFYDARSSTGSYNHFYNKKPTALSDDTDEFTFPLNSWERLIALSASVDLIKYNTSQSADLKKSDLVIARNEDYGALVVYWSNIKSQFQDLNGDTQFIGGAY